MTESTLSLEDYMAVWEGMLEWHNEAPDDDESDFIRLWHRCGTAEMRTVAIKVTVACVAAWDAMTDDERDDHAPFDWDFVPEFLKKYDWLQHWNGG